MPPPDASFSRHKQAERLPPMLPGATALLCFAAAFTWIDARLFATPLFFVIFARCRLISAAGVAAMPAAVMPLLA